MKVEKGSAIIAESGGDQIIFHSALGDGERFASVCFVWGWVEHKTKQKQT